jgi:hypothetical protein
MCKDEGKRAGFAKYLKLARDCTVSYSQSKIGVKQKRPGLKLAADQIRWRDWEQARLAERNKGSRQQTKFCLKVVLEQKQTIMQFQPVKCRPFLKVVVATPNLVTQARGMIQPSMRANKSICCLTLRKCQLMCGPCHEAPAWPVTDRALTYCSVDVYYLGVPILTETKTLVD